MGTFLFPRTVSITRPGAQTGVGAQAYGGALPKAETPVYIGTPDTPSYVASWNASIQFASASNNPTGLPGDVPMSRYWVYIWMFPAGIVQDRDIITDDLKRRHQVIPGYADSLGSRFLCTRLEG